MRTLAVLISPIAGLALATGCTANADEIARTDPGAAVFVEDNPSCDEIGLGDMVELKVEPTEPGDDLYFTIDDFYTLHVLVNGNDTTFDWDASLSMDAVIVKGGPNANVYFYDPEAFAGPGLMPPINPSNGAPYAISHISFCYDYELAVDKTADTSFVRTYEWMIDKAGSTTELTLAAGEQLLVDYTVGVEVAGWTDSDWAAAGQIWIYNPAPWATTVVEVADDLGGVPVAVDCGTALPVELGPRAELVCTYELALPDASARVNTVEVIAVGPVEGNTATAAVDFAAATIEPVDDCVTVDDSLAGPLGEVCAGAAPVVFDYAVIVGPYAECGDYTVDNTATFVTTDSGATGADTWSVSVQVPCVVGCTLTPGYWKTHSKLGPAPYDDNWANLEPNAEQSPFFTSGQTYYEALWTPPAGNAYYILAHAYIAAELNALNGAAFDAAAAAFDAATTVFHTYTPGDIAAAKGRDGVGLRSEITNLAAELDAYNNGLIGPGHCDE